MSISLRFLKYTIFTLSLFLFFAALITSCKTKTKVETIFLPHLTIEQEKDTFVFYTKLEVKKLIDSFSRVNPDAGFDETYKFIDTLPPNVSIPVLTKYVTKYVQDESLKNALIKEFESKRAELEFLNNLEKQEIESRRKEIEQAAKSNARKSNIMFYIGLGMVVFGILIAAYFLFKTVGFKIPNIGGIISKLKFK